MKKTIIMATVATMLVAYAPETQAQAFLRGLENKAKDRVLDKIEKNASKKKSAADTQSTKTNNQEETSASQGSNAPEEDLIKKFVDELAAPESNNFLGIKISDVKVDEQKETKFLSYADALKAFPALPTTDQLINYDVAPAQAIYDFKKGCIYHSNQVSEVLIVADQKAKQQIAAKRSASGAPQMNAANAMQMLQLMQKHGIDPEKASDKEMEAFVMKMIASGELNMGTVSGAVDVNYSDAQNAVIDKIQGQIDALNNKVLDIVKKYGEDVYTYGHDKKLRSLYSEQQAAWRGSDAYKQVYDIENDIENRAQSYLKNYPESVRLPEFWVSGRKQENAIIRKFNSENAEKWEKLFQEVYGDQLPLLNEFVATEKELEATFSDKQDLTYATLKQNLDTAFVQWMTFYTTVYSNTYGLPIVMTVSEDNVIAQ